MAAKAAVSSECCESELTTESAWICGAPLPVMQVPRCQSQMTNLLPLFLFAAEKVVFGRPRGAPWRRYQCGSEPIGADITHTEVEKAVSAPAVPTSHACPTRCAPRQRHATNPKAVGDDRPHRQSKKCYGQRFVLPPKKERFIPNQDS